jgi:hypothetical protein
MREKIETLLQIPRTHSVTESSNVSLVHAIDHVTIYFNL